MPDTCLPDSLLPIVPVDLVPAYLRDIYTWAYLTPWTARLLDRQWIVQAILWGNAQTLIDDALAEVKTGDWVLQPASVYGNFSRQLAERVGPQGDLLVRDIAPLQVAITRKKLALLPQVQVVWGDAAIPDAGIFDAVTCFFLLHEVPDLVKGHIVSAMLEQVRRGGKAIFVDYHRPHRRHPLKRLMKLIFDRLEPFAYSLWSTEIESLAGPLATDFRWRKTTRFGGLYQIVVAERR
jgi:ubiquinone/menaquinone biosynthesis C-methylase UbiE